MSELKQVSYPIVYFLKHYPLRALVVTLAFLIAGISEGLGVLTILPLVQFILDGAPEPNSKTYMVFENVAQWFGAELTLLNTILFMIAFITLKAITNLLAMYIVSSSAAEITAGFRKRLVAAIMNARWSYFTQKSAGYISTALNNEPQFAANCIVKQCSFIADIFQVLVYFTIALFMSWQVTSVAVGIGALCTLLLLFAFKKSRRAGQDQTNNQKALMAKMIRFSISNSW